MESLRLQLCVIDVRRHSDDVTAYNHAGGLCWRDPLTSGEAANMRSAVFESSRNRRRHRIPLRTRQTLA